jgi:hypothetical protein
MSESTTDNHDDLLEMTKQVVDDEVKLHAVLKRHIKENNCQHLGII